MRAGCGEWASQVRGLRRAGLGRAALTPVLVLDSTRAGRWERFTLGVRAHGRVLPVTWSVLPSPWPQGQCAPRVVALLARTLACWPPDRPVPLVADRGCPSMALVQVLDAWRRRRSPGATIRRRAGDWIWLDNTRPVQVGELARALRPGHWRS